MTKSSSTSTESPAAPPDKPPVATEAHQTDAAPTREGLSDKQLARAVLDRAFRPRVSEIRRLAQAVLGKPGKKDKGRKKDRKAKLARLPGQAKGSVKGQGKTGRSATDAPKSRQSRAKRD